MPGPTLYAEVGDVLVVHFRNADTKLRQAVTMHPHGVRYGPEYDGAYLGNYTRAGGFVAPRRGVHLPLGVRPRTRSAPGRTTTTAPTTRSTRSAACSARSWSRERGAKVPDVNYALMLHQLTPPDHRPRPRVPVHQRPRLRRQHPDAEGEGRPGRRDARLRDGLQLPRLPHARSPLAGHRRRADRHHHGGPRARPSPPASPRTTPAAGSTTATSSPIRTKGWRAGTTSTA